MSPPSILVQWNCEGIRPKRDQLQEIIQEKNPLCLCLQETKLPQGSDFSVNGFKSFLKNFEVPEENGNAHGGVGIWVRNSQPAHQIPIQTDLQAVAVSIMLEKRTSVCSLYLPPNEPIVRAEISPRPRSIQNPNTGVKTV